MNHNKYDPWPAHETQIVRDMACDGHTASEISRALVVRTRNAVIGWMSRNGVAFNHCRHKWSAEKKRRPKKQPSARSTRIEATHVAETNKNPPAAFIRANLFEKCQHISGDPRFRIFCDQPTAQGSSYCPEHKALCTLNPNPKVNYGKYRPYFVS